MDAKNETKRATREDWTLTPGTSSLVCGIAARTGEDPQKLLDYIVLDWSTRSAKYQGVTLRELRAADPRRRAAAPANVLRFPGSR